MKAKIFAFFTARALGDVVVRAVMASSIRELFDEGELYIYYKNDRPYKDLIASCIRNVNATLVSPDKSAIVIPMELFDPPGGRLEFPAGHMDAFKQNSLKDCNLILAGSMLNDNGINSIPLTTLRFPPERVELNDAALIKLGVDPFKWIATVYWKEPGYEFRWADHKREIYDPAPYIEIIRHIVQDLGGQVIRLGHPTPVEIPKMEGFFDLAKMPDSQESQLYAVTVSRFFIGTGSGPSAYGPAFGVPTAITDLNLCYGVWNDHDYIVTQGFQYVDENKVFRQTEAFDAGFLSQEWTTNQGKDCFLHRNSAAELIAATDEMFNSTDNCIGWRQLPEHVPKVPRPNTVALPLPEKYRRELLIPPSQRR